MSEKTLLEFPCNFPVKFIGVNSDTLLDEIKALTKKHFPDFKDAQLQCNPSKQKNYLAITITVHALNQQMLDAFYQDLTKHAAVKMVL